MTGAPAERDYAVEWGAGGVMYGWMCTLCAGISVCRSLEKIQALAELGGSFSWTVTPRCSMLLFKLTSGVILWPFIYFRGLVFIIGF